MQPSRKFCAIHYKILVIGWNHHLSFLFQHLIIASLFVRVK